MAGKSKLYTVHQDQKVLNLKSRIGYFLGGVGGTTMATIQIVGLTYYYTNILGLAIGTVALITTISRLFDGVSDIMAGILIDRTRSKWGKARPWILRMLIPHFLVLIAMFTVPPGSDTLKYIYIFVMYNLATTVINTILNVANSSLNSLMTRDMDERAQLNVLKQTGAPLMELLISAATIPLANLLGGDAKSWIIVISMFSLIATISYIFTFLWCKESSFKEAGKTEVKPPIKKSVKSLLSNQYWWIMTLVWIVTILYWTIFQTNLNYYCQYVMGNVNYASPILTVGKVATLVVTIFVVPFLIPRMTKSKMTALGACIAAFGHLIVFLGPTSLPVAMAAEAFRGAGLGFIWGVMFAMITDTVEYGDWKFHLRTEGLIFSAASLGQKFGGGIATAIVGFLLDSAAFDGTLAVQSAMTNDMISKIYYITPILCFGVVALLMVRYKLDKLMPQIVEDLHDRYDTNGAETLS